MATSRRSAVVTAPSFLTGGGEVGEAMRAHDWSRHPLGPPATWPQPLRGAIRLILNTRHPAQLFWGEPAYCFYNDAYRPALGDRHPDALGRAGGEVWKEIWGTVRPQIDRVMAGDGESWQENQLVPATRDGRFAAVYWSYSYSPIDDDAASRGVGGVLVLCSEATEQVLAAQRLSIERERLLMMLEQTPGFAAMVIGPDHRFDYVNHAFNAIGGERAFIGRTVRAAFSRGAGERFAAFLDILYASGERFAAREVPLSFGGRGGERVIDLLCQPVRDDAGDVTGIFLSGYDVSDRVHALRQREALLTLDQRLRDVTGLDDLSFAAAEVLGRTLGADRAGYGAVDGAARTVVVRGDWTAPGIAGVTGTHRFADYGHHLDDLRQGRAVVISDIDLDPRTAGHIDAFRALAIRAILDVPVIENGETVGEVFVHSATPRHWTDDEVALVRDVAERTRAAIARRSAERELVETAERLGHATDLAEIGFWDVDPVNDRLIWPARTKAMFGISPEVPVTMVDFFNGLHPDDRAVTSDAYEAAADPVRRALYDVEYRTVGKEDGVIRWVAAKGRGLFDDDGRCVRVLGTAIDVTARKRDEERLRDLNEDLEARVAERTAELGAAHEQLRQSQKMEAMGQLTGGVAHDFNNLLTPIVGALDLLMRKQVGGEREQRLIAGASQSAERARTLVQRLLAFARRQPLRPIAVDVAGLIRGMAELITTTTGPQIVVTVEAPLDLPPAEADPNQLEMALLNLAVNARDAMPEGGTLRISATAEVVNGDVDLPAGGYVRLSVADTGGGMDEATLARAIEPFFSTKGIGKGTGLGLSMAHGLASQLGGALRIGSKPGLGTNVELWLPRSHERPAVAAAAGEPAASGRRGVALLVDDDELVRVSTADMLADLGYSVVEAASGEQALSVLGDGTRIDLVVTDYLMPGMTGTDLARAARQRRAALPVLVVSGYADVDGIAPDLPRLTKPFRRDELAAALAVL